ncbi:MAG: nucleoside-diphosphate sugar epimerase/dehydratase, partial [Anaerovoracaceae bacterium]|nr:nucleoside-diphosphate sugar epimerase/dehydratase [Anaerovoracaceae bacterium]
MIVTIYLIAYDMAAVAFSYFAALFLRFDCVFSRIPEEYFSEYLKFLPVSMLITVVIFHMFRLYRSIWRFASYSELYRITIASLLIAVINTVSMTLILGRMPVSYYFFGAVLQFILTVGIRFAYRFVLLIRSRKPLADDHKRVMVIGAGNGGLSLIRDINHRSKHHDCDKVCCIIDDNSNKWGRFIEGVKVVGGREKIISACEEYHIDKIYFAIPSAPFKEKAEVLKICSETGCELKQIPGMYQFAEGDVSVSDMKNVDVEDLLGRDPITINSKEVEEFIAGKVIMVTGGGGSIGSELCRQIAARKPEKLVIFEIYENNAYDIQQELRRTHPELDLHVIIGSVRDTAKLWEVFGEYRPDVVYHAAAHKHVPLMEYSPCEAIKNNAVGTYKTAYAAICHGCERFVLISTDKAVNPTNIMGASKRLCEMIIQSFDYKVKSGTAVEIPPLFTEWMSELKVDDKPIEVALENARTEFVAVRFGNVLGSNGSVIPLFKRQIAEGGPVTVTHPDIIRYFMTIPEAVNLVLQAGTYARGGDIFVLDMGDPVKIVDLATNLIRLSGLKPGKDIDIVFTGLRPGEKLFEEKLMAEEGLQTTNNKLIFIGKPIDFDM